MSIRSVAAAIAVLLLTVAAHAADSAKPKSAPAVPLAERSFRVIEGTESPDKRYALAVGLASDRAASPEARLLSEESDYEPDAPGLTNYLVDLTAKSILTETGAKHFGTRASYNHTSCEAHWSPNGAMVLQVCSAKWHFTACRLMAIGTDGKTASALNLGVPVVRQTAAFLKKQKHRGWLEHGSKIVIAIGEVKVTDDLITLTLIGEIPKAEVAAGFTAQVALRIATGPGGEVRAEPGSVKLVD